MRKAFSVVELLVVIAIVSVLAALLLPTLSNVREQSRSALCLSNLRQLASAAQAYAGANDGRWPPSHVSFKSSGHQITIDWDFSYADGIASGAGSLWPGEKAPRVQKCPSWDGREYNNRTTPWNGYNYNVSYVGGEPQSGWPGQQGYIACVPAALSVIRQPAQTALFGDAQNTGFFANTYMRAPYPSPSELHWLGPGCNSGMSWAAANDASGGGAARRAGAQGFRHRGRANIVFCDGHAESIANMFHLPDQLSDVGFIATDNNLYGGAQ